MLQAFKWLAEAAILAQPQSVEMCYHTQWFPQS